MSEPPPPSPHQPPPGWYHDPQSGGRGFRWWDGTTWTEKRSDHPDARGEGLTPLGEWFSTLIRTVTSRLGHFFPLVVCLIVPTALLNGHSAWLAFRTGVMISDPENNQLTFTNPEASVVLYSFVGLSLLLLAAAFVVLLVAAARQANAILDEVPEEWSVSMRGASRRIPKALGLSALLAGVLFVLFWIMMISASLVPISALLMLPLWLIGTVVVCVRFSLTNITAALAPNNVGCLRTSLALTRPYFWPLVGRMALLSMFGLSLVLMLQIVATPFVAIGGGAGTAPIDLGAGEIPLVDVLGDNPAVFAIQQLFNGLAYGAVMVIWTVGFVLIYRDLSGPVEPGNSEPAEASLS